MLVLVLKPCAVTLCRRTPAAAAAAAGDMALEGTTKALAQEQQQATTPAAPYRETAEVFIVLGFH